VPIESDELGPALVLRDGRVRALEIAGHGKTAAQVVVTTYGGSTATPALAMAFVAAGADQVVAAVRPVSHAAMTRLTERLRHINSPDLVQALAQLQRQIDQTAPPFGGAAGRGQAPAGDGTGDAAADWFDFAAFGRAICDERSGSIWQ
jgi:hypothetical protein